MKPAIPVLLSVPGPICENVLTGVTLAENQDEYIPLRVLRSRRESGRVTARFELTWRERFRVLLGGNIWLQQLTFRHLFHPVKLLTEEPTLEECK